MATKTIAELVDNLFRVYRKANGREYTYTEITEALDGAITLSLLPKLRYGQVKNPSRETLLALCRFFKVPASYFFPELEEAQQEDTAPLSEESFSIALRATKLRPEIQKHLSDLVRAMEKEL